MSLRLLAFAASLRQGSLNRRLIAVASEIARADGVDVDLAEFREFDMPLYDVDLQVAQGMPSGKVLDPAGSLNDPAARERLRGPSGATWRPPGNSRDVNSDRSRLRSWPVVVAPEAVNARHARRSPRDSVARLRDRDARVPWGP